MDKQVSLSLYNVITRKGKESRKHLLCAWDHASGFIWFNNVQSYDNSDACLLFLKLEIYDD